MKGFLNFIREQGVVGLAVGFILGGTISKITTSIVIDLINPLIGGLFGTSGLKDSYFFIGASRVMYGNFLAALIDFVIISAVVYFGVKMIGLEKIDKKKE